VQVDWRTEKECFDSFLRVLADFYAPDCPDSLAEFLDQDTEFKRMMDHVLFPAFKQYLVVPNHCDDWLTCIANLPDLYKVFERC
jgi:DNA mismatch repair protein MLH1